MVLLSLQSEDRFSRDEAQMGEIKQLGHARVQRAPLEKNKALGFLSNTGPDPLGNHKATRPAFNVGPSSARQRDDDGPF